MKDSKFNKILAHVDIDLAMSLVKSARGEQPAPRITFRMVRLCQHLARIARMDGSTVNLAALYAAAIVQDRKSFAVLFRILFAHAESVVNEGD